MNKLIVSGNVGRSPELKTTNSGLEYLRFSVASNERRKRGDEWVDHTTWVSVTVFGKRAVGLSKFLDKGMKVLCEGSPEARGYMSRDGEAKAELSMVAREVEVMSSKGERRESSPYPGETNAKDFQADDFGDDDIPF